MQFRPQLLSVNVDWYQLALFLNMPELPAVAGWRHLHKGTYLMDGTAEVGADQCTVSTDTGGVASTAVG